LGDATGVGLLADWQDVGQLPVVGTPDAKHPLVSRFESHRGFVIDFSGQYLPTGDTTVGALTLELSADFEGQVNGLSVAKRGILAQTVTDVMFSPADVNPDHPMTPGTYSVQTEWNGTDWQFRVLDGASGNAVALADLDDPTGTGFTDVWQNIRKVAAESDGSRVFDSGTGLIVAFGAEYQLGSQTTGDAARLLPGVPDAQVSLAFDGGDQTTDGVGDTLRIAGDGRATGAVYQPSSSVPGGGTVTVSGNVLAFSGVEPLIVHGLPDFKMLTPDLADATRQQLQLHTLTVEGQVTWTQKKQFLLENPALAPLQVGRAIAVSDDGRERKSRGSRIGHHGT